MNYNYLLATTLMPTPRTQIFGIFIRMTVFPIKNINIRFNQFRIRYTMVWYSCNSCYCPCWISAGNPIWWQLAIIRNSFASTCIEIFLKIPNPSVLEKNSAVSFSKHIQQQPRKAYCLSVCTALGRVFDA